VETRGGPGRLSDLPDRIAGAVANRLLEVIDIDAIAQRIDVNAMARRIDMDAIIREVDADAAARQLDLDALVARLDLDAILARVDLDALLARVDLDALLARVDIAALAQRAGVPDLIADSTGQFADTALDAGRRQLVAVDTLLARAALRVTGRDPDRPPYGPGALSDAPAATQALPPRLRAKSRANVTGHYAGTVSRLLAFLVDHLVVTLSVTALAALATYTLQLLVGVDLEGGLRTGALGVGVLAGWAFLYWWLSLAVAGRTPGMALLGLRVVRSDARPLSSGRAALRVLLMPVSIAVVVVTAIGMLMDRERRAPHDLLSWTRVVYDWGDRPAELSSPLTAWLARRGAAPVASAVDPGSDLARPSTG
jgi:uncharacterized RDD family membrane protein YckC